MEKIRKAVGAIIICPNENNGYMLIKKAKISDTKNKKPKPIKPFWDIPKGGVRDSDTSDLYALTRELQEELGITDFRILSSIVGYIYFKFDASTSNYTGFNGQRTKIYYVEFLGNREDIKIDKNEIVDFDIVDYDIALKMIEYSETRHFFEKYAKSCLK